MYVIEEMKELEAFIERKVVVDYLLDYNFSCIVDCFLFPAKVHFVLCIY